MKRNIIALLLAVCLMCSNIPHMDVFAQTETIEEKFDYQETEEAGLTIVSGDMGRYVEPKAIDEPVSAGVSMTVSGKVFKLPEGAINYSYIYQESRTIASAARKGVYLLNYDQLTFYSLENLKGEEAYTFPRVVKDSYVAGGRLYVLSEDGSSDEYNSLVSIYNLEQEKFESSLPVDISASAIGVDNSGRIYLGGKKQGESYIYLLSAEGRLLSKAKALGEIYGFGGFDQSNGNFYFEQYYNWMYWGYEHDMHALGTGCVKGDDLNVCTNVIAGLISQNFYTERKYALELVGNKYLCLDNTVGSRLEIWPSNEMDASSPDGNDILFTLERDNEDELGQFDSCACLGTRTVYNSKRGSVITFQSGRTIAEYIPETGKMIGQYQTEHPVFSLMDYGDNILAIEKEEDDLYLEEIPYKPTSCLRIQGNARIMKPMGSLQLTALTDGSFTDRIQWKSSDSKVASVSQTGKVLAWHKGKVTITASNSTGQSAKCVITVKGSCPVKMPKKKTAALNGRKSDNISGNDYTRRGRVVRSYLIENANGTFSRVESVSGKVIVETYDTKTKKRKDRKMIKQELPDFGGFFSGGKYHYIVYGQMNLEESNDKEVLRIVKYSKGFERISSVSVKGANTYIPFAAGSLRMTEADNRLYIHTCHEMYDDGDGYHHQANMTYVVNESSMKVEQSYYDVLNIAQAGYVSHSFNQFIQADNNYLYRVDHGDGAPRAVSITRCDLDGDITEVNYTLPLSIGGGFGENDTGVSVGGFELSSDSCLIAGNSVPQGKKFQGTEGQRNIFVTVTPKDLSDNKVVWVTKHRKGVTVNTPQLVRLGEDQFLLMWEERNDKTKGKITKMVTLDGNGTLTSKISSHGLPLSDCKPVQFKNGLVGWYYTDGSAPTICFVNSFDLEKYRKSGAEGISIHGISREIAAGKKIKLYASVLPKEFAKKKVKWKSSNKRVATVSKSGLVTMKEGSGGKSVKITASLANSGISAVCKITSMSGIVHEIEISGSKSVKAGKTIQLSAGVWCSSAAETNTEVKWKSGNEKYATVDDDGYVTAYKAGKGKRVKITAMATDGSRVEKTVTIKIK